MTKMTHVTVCYGVSDMVLPIELLALPDAAVDGAAVYELLQH
jgi:hypothetical protein